MARPELRPPKIAAVLNFVSKGDIKRTLTVLPHKLEAWATYTAPAWDCRLSLRESTLFRGAKDDDDVNRLTGGSIIPDSPPARATSSPGRVIL